MPPFLAMLKSANMTCRPTDSLYKSTEAAVVGSFLINYPAVK